MQTSSCSITIGAWTLVMLFSNDVHSLRDNQTRAVVVCCCSIEKGANSFAASHTLERRPFPASHHHWPVFPCSSIIIKCNMIAPQGNLFSMAPAKTQLCVAATKSVKVFHWASGVKVRDTSEELRTSS